MTSLFAGYSTNGGLSWTTRTIAYGGDSLPATRGDPVAAFDDFGNLFLAYLASEELQKGTSSGGNNGNTLNDTSRNWAGGQWAGMQVKITDGPGMGQTRTITGNTASTLTVNAVWQTVPNDTSKYLIAEPNDEDSLTVVRSDDGGQSLTWMAWLDAGGGFLGVDKPWIATGPGGTTAPGSVWVSWKDNTEAISVAGAAVTGLGAVNPFTVNQRADDSVGMGLSSVAVGPSGQVLVSYMNDIDPPTAATIFVVADPDGLGPTEFDLEPRDATTTRVGHSLSPLEIPAQPERGIQAAPTLAWDRREQFHGRVYLVYTDRDSLAADDFDTDIFVRYSLDSGATWSDPVQVNDFNTNSQFLPAIAVDQSTGFVAVAWYDARNDPLNNIAADVYATASDTGGSSFVPDVRISDAPSRARDAGRAQSGESTGGNTATTLNDTNQNWVTDWWVGQTVRITGGPGAGQSRTISGNTPTRLTVDMAWAEVPNALSTYQIDPPYFFDFGDYIGLAFVNGVFYPAWADNSNSTSDNPDGDYRALDLYTAPVVVTQLPDPDPDPCPPCTPMSGSSEASASEASPRQSGRTEVLSVTTSRAFAPDANMTAAFIVAVPPALLPHLSEVDPPTPNNEGYDPPSAYTPGGAGAFLVASQLTGSDTIARDNFFALFGPGLRRPAGLRWPLDTFSAPNEWWEEVTNDWLLLDGQQR